MGPHKAFSSPYSRALLDPCGRAPEGSRRAVKGFMRAFEEFEDPRRLHKGSIRLQRASEGSMRTLEGFIKKLQEVL